MVSVAFSDGRYRTFTGAWIETYWEKRIKKMFCPADLIQLGSFFVKEGTLFQNFNG
jgi:hypothetical protein